MVISSANWRDSDAHFLAAETTCRSAVRQPSRQPVCQQTCVRDVDSDGMETACRAYKPPTPS